MAQVIVREKEKMKVLRALLRDLRDLAPETALWLRLEKESITRSQA